MAGASTIRNASTIVAVFVFSALAFAQTKPAPLRTEMQRLHVDTVFLTPAQEVREKLLWSPDSRYLAIKLKGSWRLFDTGNVILMTDIWHEQNIGVVEAPGFESVDIQTAKQWSKITIRGTHHVKTHSGTTVSIYPKDMVLSFTVKRHGQKARDLWHSTMENCHSLAVAPNDHWVAFICDAKGVFITDLELIPKSE